MKRLTCEMCGGTDLVKDGGVFVCQSCGCKYSLEEAKKMMIEGTVDVSGSKVKIDTSDEIDNLFLLARNARKEGNADNASKYYEMILLKKPNDWEAYFYSTYYKASSCRIGEMVEYGNKVQMSFMTMLSQLGTDDRVAFDERPVYFTEIVCDCIKLFSNYYYNAKKMYLDANDKSYYENDYCNRTEACMVYCGNIGNAVSSANEIYKNDELRKAMLLCWKTSISFVEDLHNNIPGNYAPVVSDYVAKIKKYEPTYVAPTFNTSTTNSSDGCYVATAVYGSYDCPQVWTLRRFRDFALAESWYGRAFIRTYYAISPTLVKWFGHTDWFKNMWKGTLDRMVSKLNAEGVENTPYEDRVW